MENDAHRQIMDKHRSRFDALRTRHEDGTAPKAIAAFNLFQTPEALASRMVALADIQPHHSVLEPSAGLGRLLKAIQARNPDRVHACEQSTDCCAEIFKNFPTVELSQGDFLEKHLDLFDRIVMNPPFKMRRDLKHIEHAAGHLAPGGVLVGLCLAGPIRYNYLRERCDHWEILPPSTFAKEGTKVETILFRITNK